MDEMADQTSVDWANCDREPMPIPRQMQPQGVPLVLPNPEPSIIQVSGNTPKRIGRLPKALLSTPCSHLLNERKFVQLKQDMQTFVDCWFEVTTLLSGLE